MLRDPRDRFDMNRMEREDRAGQSRARYGKVNEQPPDEQRVDHVQGDIHQVIAGWIQSP